MRETDFLRRGLALKKTREDPHQLLQMNSTKEVMK